MTTSRSDDEPVIRIVAGVAVDESGRVLLVRKRGTERFMLPGGKLAEGEGAGKALARELQEELDCTLAAEPCSVVTYLNGWHLLLRDHQRKTVFDDIIAWAAGEPLPSLLDLPCRPEQPPLS